jgi:hypothetical protein
MQTKIAGLSFSGGRKDDFYFCLMEYFPDQQRWFLNSLLQVKDEDQTQSDKVIGEWINRYQVESLVVDFPVKSYACQNCTLDCPGQEICPVEEVKEIREKIKWLLAEDEKLYKKDPKAYEYKRTDKEELIFSRNPFQKHPTVPLLSKAFKRRLKKGYLPYWNRPIDLWIWSEYYDSMLELFSGCYDSYGDIALKLVHRFEYMKKHLPNGLKLQESRGQICLLEGLRAGLYDKRMLREFFDLERAVFVREALLKKLEETCQIFIYEKDMELLITKPRAFESFLLALVGQRQLQNKVRPIGPWADTCNFIIPSFENDSEELR